MQALRKYMLGGYRAFGIVRNDRVLTGHEELELIARCSTGLAHAYRCVLQALALSPPATRYAVPTFSLLPSTYDSLRIMDGWILPFDVLAKVMAHAQSCVIAAMMGTCQALYGEGPRHLLRDGVVLRGTRDMEKFTTFMLSADTSRFVFFRKLVVETGYLSQDGPATKFSQILKSPALCLNTLILQEVDILYAANHTLFTALSQATTVKHLVLMDGDNHGPTMLLTSLFHLVSATVTAGRIELAALKHHAETLESVCCEPFGVHKGMGLLDRHCTEGLTHVVQVFSCPECAD